MKTLLVVLVAGSLVPAALSDQTPGQTIRAKDGDVILVENNDKVRIVRRRHANVRVIYNAARQWVVVLADWLSVPGGGDGRVDWSYTFRQLTGTWPLGERWEGAAYVDEYDTAGMSSQRGLGLTTSGGLIQILGSVPSGRDLIGDKTFAEGSAIAIVTFRGSGTAIERDGFDVAEQRAMTRLAQEASGEPVTVGPGGIRSSVQLGVVDAGSTADPSGSQPVRVGGNIRAPQKIKDAPGVLPEAARQAGVFGMVILEIVIGTDGTVQQAKVLRSIPMLDEAAIAAVKQWVYEPTQLNGMPVPVIMTAAVSFR